MRKYQFFIAETIVRNVLYFVEGESKEEAEDKALRGETISAEIIREVGVVNRELLS